MQPEITFAKWEEFLSGSLEAEEQQALENALQEDSDLQAQFALYQEVRNAQKDPDLDQFVATLNEVRAETVNPIRIPMMRKIAVAASIAAGILILLWFTMRPDKTVLTTQELYAEYAVHEINIQQMSVGPELGAIQNLLRAKKYAEALPLINSYLDTYPDAADVMLLRGISLLETGQVKEAITCFQRLEENHPIYTNEAKWYQALSLLKNEQVSAAVTALTTIPSESSRYQNAQALLKKIGKKDN